MHGTEHAASNPKVNHDVNDEHMFHPSRILVQKSTNEEPEGRRIKGWWQKRRDGVGGRWERRFSTFSTFGSIVPCRQLASAHPTNLLGGLYRGKSEWLVYKRLATIVCRSRRHTFGTFQALQLDHRTCGPGRQRECGGPSQSRFAADS